MATGVKIKFDSKKDVVKKGMSEKKRKILYAMGLKWQEIANKVITRNGIVDTGRLRGSLTFITPFQRGGSVSSVASNKPSDFLGGSAPQDSVIVGSNVPYASRQEFENKKGAFVKPSILNYKDDYKAITEAILKE